MRVRPTKEMVYFHFTRGLKSRSLFGEWPIVITRSSEMICFGVLGVSVSDGLLFIKLRHKSTVKSKSPTLTTLTDMDHIRRIRQTLIKEVTATSETGLVSSVPSEN